MLSGYRLKLLDTPIERIGAHRVKQFSSGVHVRNSIAGNINCQCRRRCVICEYGYAVVKREREIAARTRSRCALSGDRLDGRPIFTMPVGVVVSYQCWEYDAVRGIDRPAIKLKADREHPHRPRLSNGWTRSAAART